MKIHMKVRVCRQKEDAEVLGMIFLHINKTFTSSFGRRSMNNRERIEFVKGT